MITPDAYSPELADYLRRVVSAGNIPTKYFLKKQEIEAILTNYLDAQCDADANICLLGSRDLNVPIHNRNITYYDDRTFYQDLVDQKYKRHYRSNITEFNVEEFDCVVIFSDWIAGLLQIDRRLETVNEFIIKPNKLILIEYNFLDKDKFVEINDQLEILNWCNYRRWFKHISSHMHLGYQRVKYETLDLIDLSPDY